MSWLLARNNPKKTYVSITNNINKNKNVVRKPFSDTKTGNENSLIFNVTIVESSSLKKAKLNSVDISIPKS